MKKPFYKFIGLVGFIGLLYSGYSAMHNRHSHKFPAVDEFVAYFSPVSTPIFFMTLASLSLTLFAIFHLCGDFVPILANQYWSKQIDDPDAALVMPSFTILGNRTAILNRGLRIQLAQEQE